jgi:exosortase
MPARNDSSSRLRQAAEWSLLLLAAAHVPLVVAYYVTLWNREHYQFFPFALIACGVLAYLRRDPEAGWRWSWLSRALVALDATLLLVASLVNSPWAAAVAAALLTLAVLMAARDREANRSLAYLAILPWLTLKLPLGYDLTVIQWLQTATTRLASRVLLDLSYLHVRQGNVLQFPTKTFLVEEACSGVQSLFTLLFLAALLCCWKRRGLVHMVALFVAAFAVAGIMNLLRVLAVAMLWESVQIDFSTGWPHELLGHAVLLVATGLLWSADAFFFLLDAPVSSKGRLPSYVAAKVAWWNRIFGGVARREAEPAGLRRAVAPVGAWQGVVAPLFALVCLASQAAAMWPEDQGPPPQGKGLALFPDASLPADLSGFEKRGYEEVTREVSHQMGQFSNIWKYANSRSGMTVSCDQAYFGWHDLTVCYTANGWIAERSWRETRDGWQAAAVDMFHPGENRYAVVVFSAFDQRGRPVEPPPENALDSKLSDLFRAWRRSEAQSREVCYQAQNLAESLVPLTAEERQSVLELHFAARERLRAALLDDGS